MPYSIRRKGSRWEVVNADTGEVKARHTSKAKAEKQMALLRGIEKGWTPTGEPDTYMRKGGSTNVKLRLTGGKRRGKAK